MTGNPFKRLMAIPDETTRLKAAIAELILNLPDNPLINRLGNKCFTIQWKDTGVKTNLSPFYHDFKSQAEFIQRRVLEMDPTFIITYLKRIVRNQTDSHKGNWYTFNPKFIEHLKTLIETYGVK